MKTAEETRKDYELAVAQREATKRKELNEYIKERTDYMKRNFKLEIIEKRIKDCANSCCRYTDLSGLENYSSKTYTQSPNEYRDACKQYFYDRMLQVFDDNNKYMENIINEIKAAGYEVECDYTTPLPITNYYTKEVYRPKIINNIRIKW